MNYKEETMKLMDLASHKQKVLTYEFLKSMITKTGYSIDKCNEMM